MSTDNIPPARRSLRLSGYDYSRENWYFVTLCVQGRESVFGEVVEANVHLSLIGEIVRSVWNALPQRFPYVRLDKYIIMADHLHGIIVIEPKSSEQASINQKRHTLGWTIGEFKGASSFMIHKHLPQFQWQHDFHDHIIRNYEDLNRIRNYIIENPLRHWLKSQKPREETK